MKLINIILITLIIILLIILLIILYKKKGKCSIKSGFRRSESLLSKYRRQQYLLELKYKKQQDLLNQREKNIETNHKLRSNVLSFSGGGIRSITIGTGAVTGILRKLTQIDKRQELNDYLNQYRVISGNSGGSWFMTLLAYSKTYYNMLNSAGDLKKYPIAGKMLTCKGGEPIKGSQNWRAPCNVFRNNIQKCGDKCCCNVGFEYTEGRWWGDCEKCEEDGAKCNTGKPIPKSDKWWSCYYSNMGSCQNGDYCCCDDNYELDSTGEYCKPCVPGSVNTPFTFYEYLDRIFQVKKSWAVRKFDPFMESIAIMSPNWIRPILYYYYNSWHKIINQIIFNPVEDIPQNMKLNQPINDINSHFIWSAAILRYSNIINLENDGAINCYMTNPFMDDYVNSKRLKNESYAMNTDLKQQGMVFPSFFNYDVQTKTSPIDIVGGKINSNGNMVYEKDTEIIRLDSFLNKASDKSKQNIEVRGASSAGGAPAGFLSSKMVIKQALLTAGDSNIGAKYLSNIGSDRVSKYISEYFNDLSVPVELDKDGNKNFDIKIVCDGQFDKGSCKEFDDSDDIKNIQDIKDKKIVKMVDGGFYDNSSVAYAVRGWQEHYTNDSSCKIVYINSIPNDTSLHERSGKQQKTNSNVFLLFGCELADNIEYANCDNTNKIFNYFGPKSNTKAWVALPTVFEEDDYQNGKTLWWKRCNKYGYLNKECNNEDNLCYAELSIVHFETTTVTNKELGVRPGSKVDLFTINFNTTKASIFVNPGSSDEEDDLPNYIITANKVSELIQDIDTDLFEVIFTEKYDLDSEKIKRHEILKKYSNMDYSNPRICKKDDTEMIEGFDNSKYTGKNQNIFVFDTGIHISHNEFNHNKIFNLRVGNNDIPELKPSSNTVFDLNISKENNDNYFVDNIYGHGTHVACIIGGKNIGVSPDANIYGIKTGRISDDGKKVEENENDMLSCLRSANEYVRKHKMKSAVFSISTGQTYWDYQKFYKVAEESKSLNIIWVVSAGFNTKKIEPDFVPAMLTNSNVITVSSPGNFPKDDYVDVYVEGRNINSCSWKNNNNYIKLSGTSMSTPKVSGFLARMLEKYDGDVDKSLLNLYKNLDENKMLVIN
jgi:hypothetical protein